MKKAEKANKKRIAHNARVLESSIGTFPSFRAASKATGVEEGTIQSRIAKGWSADQALGVEPAPPRKFRGSKVVCAGVTYDSKNALARAFGLNPIRVSKRLSRNWTPEQAVDLEPAPPRFRDHHGHARNHMWKERTKIKGKLVIDAPAGSYRLYRMTNSKNNKEYIGITTNDLQARLRGHRRQAKKGTRSPLYNAMRHHGIKNFYIELLRDDASDFIELQNQEVEEIARRQTMINGYNTAAGGAIGSSKSVVISGQTFPSQAAAAMFYGVDVAVFNLRLNRLGWSPEEAVGLSSRPFNRHIIEVNGTTYKSLKSAAEAVGIDYKLAHDRYKAKKWTYAEALGIDPPPRVPTRKISFRGVDYESLAAFSEAYGLDPDTVSARLARGESLEHATRPAARGNGKIVKYKGATYGSYSALARAEGIKPELFTARIRKGLTVAQAVKELK